MLFISIVVFTNTIKLCIRSLDELKDFIKSLVCKLDGGLHGCTKCQFSSTRASAVEVHVEAKHVESAGLACPLCGKHCPTRNSLAIHKYRYHRNTVN